VCDPQAQLDAILGLQQAPGATPFALLDNLYLQLLHAALSESNPGPFLKRFQAVVGCIILLRDPLPFDMLARFVVLDDDRVFVVLSQLHSVIIPPSEIMMHLEYTTLLPLTFSQTLQGVWIITLLSLFPHKNVSTPFNALS
jgi:hypothetical protein